MVTSRTCIRFPNSPVELKTFQVSTLAFSSRQLKQRLDSCIDVYVAACLTCCAMLPVPCTLEVIQRIVMSQYTQTICNKLPEETTSDQEGTWNCISIRKMEDNQNPRSKSSLVIAPKENLLVGDFLILIHNVDEGELRMEVSSMKQTFDLKTPRQIRLF